jgi:hypothetical protein
LPLGLHPGRTVDAGDLGTRLAAAWLANPHHHVARVVGGRAGLLTPATTAPAATPLTLAFAVTLGAVGVTGSVLGLVGRGFIVALGRRRLAIGGVITAASTTATSAAAPTPAPALALGLCLGF